MTAVESIEFFTAINFAVIGLSHFLQPKIWVEFFSFLYGKRDVGNIINALIALGMGSIIVSFHFVWKFPMILVTIYGISQILKGLIYLVLPEIGLKSISKVTIEKAYKFKWAGLLMVVFSLGIFYNLTI